jgi:SpoVK/Ycf46/Vps4 family AAA+-type ATPase
VKKLVSKFAFQVHNLQRYTAGMLLTGPVGAGKTAAVYAAAREFGFTVIEVGLLTHRLNAVET